MNNWSGDPNQVKKYIPLKCVIIHVSYHVDSINRWIELETASLSDVQSKLIGSSRQNFQWRWRGQTRGEVQQHINTPTPHSLQVFSSLNSWPACILYQTLDLQSNQSLILDWVNMRLVCMRSETLLALMCHSDAWINHSSMFSFLTRATALFMIE